MVFELFRVYFSITLREKQRIIGYFIYVKKMRTKLKQLQKVFRRKKFSIHPVGECTGTMEKRRKKGELEKILNQLMKNWNEDNDQKIHYYAAVIVLSDQHISVHTLWL